MSLSSFYQGKKILITGHTGFKGAWLAFWLNKMGAKVVGYALAPAYERSLFDLLQLNQSVEHHEGDIQDLDHVGRVFKATQPDIVFHLAAQALVRRSYDEPLLTLGTNVMGSAHVLEAIRCTESVRSLVYITSDKCYWNNEWVWGYRETDALGGPDPYSASKACAEHVFKSYFLSYFKDRPNFGCASTRAGNVIGGGDRASDRIVPDIVRAIEKDQPIVLRNPQATRPWQHVLDPLHGYLHLGMQLYQVPKIYNGEAWNFGPSNHSIKTVFELSKLLQDVWPHMSIKTEQEHGAPHECNLLHLSIDKAQDLLKWQPRWDFRQAVLSAGEWYKKVLGGENAHNVTSEQIDLFTHAPGVLP